MIDIHCHILPGLDDGAKDMATAIEMAAIAVRDGIDTVIATPHVNPSLSLEKIHGAVAGLQQVLDGEGIPLKLLSGGEVPFGLLREEKSPLTLGESNAILVEFLPDFIPDDAEDVLMGLIRRGYVIIIAHPERNRVFMRHPDTLNRLLVPGVFLQVTAMGFKGSFGPDVSIFAHTLLKKGMIRFIASDAHDTAFRRPEFSWLLSSASKKKYRQALYAIIHHHPETMFC
ncbi:hypothetical protein OOT00_13885 [Desulfobotulus sp. H1]|uniref:protein-tyrosine-phosphatase n=1 Tax=Desulfobotulus pelophilus TaxID=2823377 RepID=A0ABT3NC76_9BACT|nr:CpsB/CapC family capsule biosynthesis tyrosine phosphatase [Desulfobotulus pelophilus]MCW7755075.1 hypothetical protein [Desulfobotulus pelophilus]